MFKKKLELAFIALISISILILINNYYNSYTFKNNPLSSDLQNLILKKEQDVLRNMQVNYGFSFKVPLIVTDKFKDKRYGSTTYRNGIIKIYLNKNVMQESMDYMLESVIAHEYAHALMFKNGNLHLKDDGHSEEWKEACLKLGGMNCEQYVNVQEVIMGKLPF